MTEVLEINHHRVLIACKSEILVLCCETEVSRLVRSMLLFVVIGLLVLCVAIYVRQRRKSHDGSAGGPCRESQPPSQCDQRKARTFSVAQVESHNTLESLWLIVKGRVYDLTEYVALHPGGESIFRNGGKDSTAGFSGSQHPARVWDMVSICSSMRECI